MKYTVKLTTGETLEHAHKGLWENLLDSWNWRYFKVDGKIIGIAVKSIAYIVQEK